MTKEEKQAAIEVLKGELESTPAFYLTDSSTMTVAQINDFRRICFKEGIRFQVAKNTLIQKALESIDGERYAEVIELLHGPTSIMISDNIKLPATVLKAFRKGKERPKLKGAFIDTATYKGDDQLDVLAKLKSKEELVGEIIGLLQSPAKNVISALQSGGQKIAGIVKTLQERPE